MLSADEAVLRQYEIDLSRDINSQVLSKPGKINGLGKGLGALAIADAVSVAFGVASDTGVSIYALMSGDTLDEARCEMPDWYNGAVGVLTLGRFGSCNLLPYAEPNAGVVAGFSELSYGGYSARFEGMSSFSPGFSCWTTTGSLPTGYATFMFGSIGNPGVWVQTGPQQVLPYVCASGKGAPAAPPLRIVRLSTGEVVASQTALSADPTRQIRCKMSSLQGDVVTSEWMDYTEGTGFPAGAWATQCEETANAQGFVPTSIGIETKDPAGTISEIGSTSMPAEVEPETGRKSLVLYYATPGGEWDSCFGAGVACADWWEETSQATVDVAYKCRYGDAEVALSECAVYKSTFAPGGAGTITDPETGTQIEWGTKTGPNTTDPGVGPTPGERCIEEWSSVANPIEWVLQPVKCALVWAFVPRTTAVETAVAGLGAAAGDVAAVDPLLGLVAALPSSSGCDGIPISLTFFGQEWDGRLLEACEGEARAAATVVNGLITLALVTGAVLSIVRYAAAVFSFVGPGGQFESATRQAEGALARRSGKGSD